jgi:tetratricopeptide (TPR) repeat protein
VTKQEKPVADISVNNELRAAQDFVLLNPSNAQGYYELGVKHVKLGNLGWAKSNFEKALALNYKLKNAYIALIELSLARNNKEAARAYYYKAIGVYNKAEFEDQLQLIKSK